MATAFSSTADEAIRRKVDPNLEEQVSITSAEQLGTLFELDGCCQWISAKGFKRVALQFSDNYLKDAAQVCRYLVAHTDANVFILADTSYGSCCVDEVAAEHYNADSIIHFGHACLSPVRRLEVLHVFCNRTLDIDDCCEKIRGLIQDNTKHIVLLADVAYQYALASIQDKLLPVFTNIVKSLLDHETKEDSTADAAASKTYRFFSRNFTVSDVPLSDCLMFYVGPESMTLTNWMMTLNKCTFYSYNPLHKQGRLETVAVNRMLNKRFFLVEKAKDAKIVGILAGTLGVADYLLIIRKLKDAIKAAGKKYYTFSMGKLNVPKLANFSEVDVYVLVSCSESMILDVSDYYQPIVTPFEMEMACNANREWTGEYVADFRDLLPGGQSFVPLAEDGSSTADVSLISGKIRRLAVDDDDDTSDKTLSVIHGNRITAKDILKERSWTGLNATPSDTPVVPAKEGRKGIAMSYTHEPEDT